LTKHTAPGNLIKIGVYQFDRFTKDVFHWFVPFLVHEHAHR